MNPFTNCHITTAIPPRSGRVRSNGQVRVVAVDGDPECGGGNIDELLFQEVLKFLKQKGHEFPQPE